MRVIAVAALLLVAPVASFAYVTECGPWGGPGLTGPKSGVSVDLVIVGTNLHLQNRLFAEAFEKEPFTPPLLGVPVVSVNGTDIHITQQYTPPPVPSTPNFYVGFCQSEDVNVGVLPPALYTIVWTYVTPAGPVDIGRNVRIDAKPCSATPLARAPVLSVTRTSGGTAHVHVESIFGGNAPVFGIPTLISNNGGDIWVSQPVTDPGPLLVGESPPATLCHAEDLDLGILLPGVYTLVWNYPATVDGMPAGTLAGPEVSFVWSGSEMRCSTVGVFSTSPARPVNTGPVTLSFSRAVVLAQPLGIPSISVSGSQVAVREGWDSEGPTFEVPPPLFCYTTSVTVPALSIGGYDVEWAVVDLFGTDSTLSSFHFDVVQGRRRAAR